MGADERVHATLWVVLAAATLTVMAGAILGPVVPAISAGLGVSGALAGLIITTHGILIVLVSPVAGAIIDRVGPRRPFVVGLFLYGVGGGAGLVVDSFLPLLASRVVLGVGVAFVYTGVTVLIFSLYDGQRMDRALGLRSSANSLGAAVWPLVGGALGSLSWQAPFAVYLVAIPLGLVAVLTVPETARGRDAGPDTALSERLRGLAGLLAERPAILAVYLLYFTANVLLYAVVVYYPQLLGEVGVSATLTVGLYLAVNGAAGGVVSAVYDRLVARAGRTWLVAAAGALWVVGFALATVVATPLAAVGPVVFVGFGIGLVFPSAFAWIEALAPPDRQGSLSSYVASAGYLGQFCSPLAFGLVVPLGGVRAVFTAAAGVAALTLGGALLAGRRAANDSI